MKPSFYHWATLSALILLAAALACNMPGVGTQPAVSEALTPTVMATDAATAEVAPTQTATEETVATPEPTTVTSTVESATPAAVDQCTLITAAEAESLLGEPVGEPTPVEGGCFYQEPAERLHVVTVFAAQGQAGAQVLSTQMFLLSFFGLELDEAAMQESEALTEAGDVVGLVEQMTTLAVGHPAFHAEAVEGLGDAALWVWKDLEGAGAPQQGFLVAAQGETIVGINLVVGDNRVEADALADARPLVEQILNRLSPTSSAVTFPFGLILRG